MFAECQRRCLCENKQKVLIECRNGAWCTNGGFDRKLTRAHFRQPTYTQLTRVYCALRFPSFSMQTSLALTALDRQISSRCSYATLAVAIGMSPALQDSILDPLLANSVGITRPRIHNQLATADAWCVHLDHLTPTTMDLVRSIERHCRFLPDQILHAC